MSVKTCTLCNQELPITNEFFYRRSDCKDGFYHECKSCLSKRAVKNAKKNIEKKRIWNKNYKLRQDQLKMHSLNNLHQWIKKRKERSKYCMICNEIKKVELSNISGEYLKNINDYWWLCHSCHHLFDKTNNTHRKVSR